MNLVFKHLARVLLPLTGKSSFGYSAAAGTPDYHESVFQCRVCHDALLKTEEI